MKNKTVNLLFHLLVLALAIITNQPKALDFRSLICYAVTLLFLLISFYTCYYWLVPYYLEKKKIIAFISLLFVLLNLITVIGYFSLLTAIDTMSGRSIHLFYRLNMHLSGITVITAAALFGIAFRLIIKWYKMKYEKILIEKRKMDSIEIS